MAKPESVRKGSRNVFADLGLAEAEEQLAKAELLRFLTRLGRDVEIRVKPGASNRHGRLRIAVR